jgi:HD-GYP domain-containing protein (c-di-GMP phosphodiesterase class II)
MDRPIKLSGALVFAVCWVFLLVACAAQPSTVTPLSDRVLRVVMDDNYPPYVFLGANGNPQGILIDQWQLWEQKTGVRVEISAMDWGEALEQMKAGQFDVIDTIFYTEDRSKYFDYSKPYQTIDVPIFFHRNISGISDASSLYGFAVAVKRGDAAIDMLRAAGVHQLVEYDSYEDIIQAASEEKVVVFVMDQPPALYLLYKNGLHSQFRYTYPLYSGQFHRAVRKGDTETLALVQKGFDAISSQEYDAIQRKWQGVGQVDATTLRSWGIGAGLLGAIFLAMVLWNRALQVTVQQNTAELRRMIEELNEARALAQLANQELAHAYDATLAGWADALELREHETAGHSQRVVNLTLDLARRLGFSEEALVHVRRGALLHDIGKMGIPDAVLLKPTELTKREWEIMKQHPMYAYQLLIGIPYLREAIDIPYLHHERWDGSGYPLGLKGEAIPLAARIFAVVDVWDALTSDRPYRRAWPCQMVLDYLRAQAGKTLDPQVVEAFLQLIQELDLCAIDKPVTDM